MPDSVNITHQSQIHSYSEEESSRQLTIERDRERGGGNNKECVNAEMERSIGTSLLPRGDERGERTKRVV